MMFNVEFTRDLFHVDTHDAQYCLVILLQYMTLFLCYANVIRIKNGYVNENLIVDMKLGHDNKLMNTLKVRKNETTKVY